MRKARRPHQSHDIHVQVDRVQVASWAPGGRKPPPLKGFAIARDSFVRCQTTTATYARCRQYKRLNDDTKIFWQYQRQKGWLKPWKITLVADDQRGLSEDDIELVLRHCKFYRFLIVEIALDFSPRSGVTGDFVRRHAVFGKSRRKHTIQDRILYWGGRKSEKFVRCYEKQELARYRVELELHSQLLGRENIATLDDFDGLPILIYPKHLQFVEVDWERLRHYLRRKVGKRRGVVIAAAQQKAMSISRIRRYLRRKGVVNFHRFLVPQVINEKIDRAFTRWIRDFEDFA